MAKSEGSHEYTNHLEYGHLNTLCFLYICLKTFWFGLVSRLDSYHQHTPYLQHM
jgi:hypothetical protein